MAKRIDCFYGQSGAAKSESVVAVMIKLWESEGLASRVIIGDGSRATYEDHGLIEAGVCEVVDYSLRDWPMTTMQRLCEGYWPEDVNDPTSPLKAPKPEDLKKLGVFAVEGLSVGSEYLMGDMKGGLAEQAGRGIKIGQDSPVFAMDVLYDDKGKAIKDSGPATTFGGNPLAHYGFAQRRMLANVERTKAFPNIVIWTAHERSAEDRISKEKLVGPAAAGEAITAQLPRIFNNTLHFMTVANTAKKLKDTQTDQMVKDIDAEWRIYTRDHFHPDGQMFVKYKAVTRGVCEKDGLKLFYTSDIPGAAITEFYAFIAKLKGERKNTLAERRGGKVA